ncbi:hypothetical protein [Spiroplasma tabanidicola]|uniref:Transmembrane protein n=1 Tax=Spiroplasma tabanidicola TaxID=324079 RepID=A0A6I6CCD7_9MOLU|nr:hypothetical protein [Spiroplasma tabanidicola]QGS51634.1 hypothetical protein STABA_v1c02680 [Spiroplasma tabanidicola]
MKAVRNWRFVIFLFIDLMAILVMPFLVIAKIDTGWVVSYTIHNLQTLDILNIMFALLYLTFSIVANCTKDKVMKVFGGINVVASLIFILIIGMYCFADLTSNSSRIMFGIMLMIFVAVDIILTILSTAVNLQATTIIQQVGNGAYANSDISSVPMPMINNVEIQDSTALKARIHQMQGGLSKSYDEAIDEIEKTGYLNGIKVGLDLNDSDDAVKIKPLSIEEARAQNIVPQEVLQPKKENNSFYETEQINTVQQFQNAKNDFLDEDPLASIYNNEDYDSISSTSLSRKDSGLAGGFKYLAKKRDDSSH